MHIESNNIDILNKILVMLSVISICFSCNNFQKENLNTRKIQLIDSLGEITITLPEDFDTFHQWRRVDDHTCGNEMFYRLQSSKYSMTEESGFFAIPPDTFFGLTIKHIYHRECDKVFTGWNPKIIKENEFKKRIDQNPKNPFEFIKNEKINGMDYLFFSTTDSFPAENTIKKFTAITQLKQIPLKFEFYTNLDTFQSYNFIEQCIGIMKTVKINKH